MTAKQLTEMIQSLVEILDNLDNEIVDDRVIAILLDCYEKLIDLEIEL